MADVPILTLILLVPLLGALLIAVLPRHRHDLIRVVALVVALLAFGLSLALLASFDPAAPGLGGFTFVESVPWIPAFGIEYTVGIDGISLVLVVLTTLLTWISILASFRPINDAGQGIHDLVPPPRGRHARRLRRPSTCSCSTSSGRSCWCRCT